MADGGPGASEGTGDHPDDLPDGPAGDPEVDLDEELGGLDRWAAEARVDQAVGERRRTAWLGRQPDRAPTLADLLVGAAERSRPVVVELLGGRRHRGLVTVVGDDMVELGTESGTVVLVAFAAIGSVRLSGPTGSGVGEPRPATAPPTTHLAAELARLAEDRPRVHAVSIGATTALSGTLVAAGPHLVVVRLEGGDVAYAPLAALAEVSLPESG